MILAPAVVLMRFAWVILLSRILFEEISPWFPSRPDPDRCAHTGGLHRGRAGNPTVYTARYATHRRPDDGAAGSRRPWHARPAGPSAAPPRRGILEGAPHVGGWGQDFATRRGHRASHRVGRDRPGSARIYSVRV